MPVLDTCKFEKVAIDSEASLPGTSSNMGLFSAQGRITLRQIVQFG